MKKDTWRPGWQEFKRTVKYDGPPLLVTVQMDSIHNATALADTGCQSYGLISEKYVRRHQLERIPIEPRRMRGFDGLSAQSSIAQVARAALNVGGNHQACVYFYVVPHLDGSDIILGLPWMRHQNIWINPKGPTGVPVLHLPGGLHVPSVIHEPKLEIHQISAASFHAWRHRQRRDKSVHIFAASMKDIEKALQVKTYSDPREKLPRHYHHWLDVFDRKKADALPPHRGPQIDHQIELVPDERGRTPEPPWGPLYNMSREELLVLRKNLQELLDKQFIRVSSSPAAAPVLFARKPGGGLRFCCDYRALNAISKKDRYPLPLINETLERIGKARWFTKLDVIAAFHKIRIAKGQEWLTSFRTRFGLFEWLVTPFGLANAPSTFQRYVNWVLRDFLDEFASAYLDDILIFSSGSLRDHQRKVSTVLQRLADAGLQLDVDKCEFEVQSTKYLGFIVEAGKGVRMDPAKVEAIQNWQAPTTVRGVRSFLGFANFYRRFIRNFADVTAPLTALTQKGMKFVWSKVENEAFERLKRMFVTAPILTQFSPERDTMVEADSSGWATGGVLSQYVDGVLRPCAYFSRKNLPAECNYEIHDKELLAIINCLKEWEPELMSTAHFVIITDHKNLRYFMQLRRLNERQMRWSDLLSRYNFNLRYRPGKLALTPDALSRRDQDMPINADDERLKGREKCLFSPEMFKVEKSQDAVRVSTVQHAPYLKASLTTTKSAPNNRDQETQQTMTLEDQWHEAEQQDEKIPVLKHAVREGFPRFPKELRLHISIGECELDGENKLLFRKRRWVPDNEALRTRLMQEAHDTTIAGHPGHNTLYGILARTLFWPNMSADVKRLVRNCDKCGANTIWRDRRQGLLRPLPIPERKWREISIDFIEKLPISKGCMYAMVVVDRLTKGMVLVPCTDITTETVVYKLLSHVIAYHGIPSAITSDRGTQFVNEMWEQLCRLLGIHQRLSTAYHPQTDGQTERTNATVEAYIRKFCNYAQDDWALLLPMAQLAISNHDSASTGMSPFFLDHGYHLETLDLREPISPPVRPKSMKDIAENIVMKMKGALELAQADLAAAQQRQEEYTNHRRNVAPVYQPGSKVWLDLRDIWINHSSKKLDAWHAKFTVLEQVSPHAYRLDTPAGIHPVFHVDKLRPASIDSFPSQRNDDYQPPAVLVEGEEEWLIERLLEYRTIRWGKGYRRQYLVKWLGYQHPTWTDAHLLQDTTALDDFECQKGRSHAD